MAKKVDELMRDGVRNAFGEKELTIIQLQAEIAMLRERLSELEPKPEPSGVASTSVSPG